MECEQIIIRAPTVRPSDVGTSWEEKRSGDQEIRFQLDADVRRHELEKTHIVPLKWPQRQGNVSTRFVVCPLTLDVPLNLVISTGHREVFVAT